MFAVHGAGADPFVVVLVLFRVASVLAIASWCGYVVSAIVVIAVPTKDPEEFANVRLFPMWHVFCMFSLTVFFIPVSLIMSRIFNLVSRGLASTSVDCLITA